MERLASHVVCCAPQAIRLDGEQGLRGKGTRVITRQFARHVWRCQHFRSSWAAVPRLLWVCGGSNGPQASPSDSGGGSRRDRSAARIHWHPPRRRLHARRPAHPPRCINKPRAGPARSSNTLASATCETEPGRHNRARPVRPTRPTDRHEFRACCTPAHQRAKNNGSRIGQPTAAMC